MRPLIGISASVMELEWAGHLPMPATVAWSSYSRAIAAAGGVPVVLVPDGDGIDEIMAIIHGLVLPGGPDLDPALYGEAEVHPTVYGINHDRDRFELALARAAVIRDLPLLAICRGSQVLNVALGGTLYQDLPTQHRGQTGHRQIAAAHLATHDIDLTTGSCLAAIYGRNRISANSFHHQAVRTIAPGLQTVGWSGDGVIEAIEHQTNRFVVGLQWHPEVMFDTSVEHIRPFQALVNQALAGYRSSDRVGTSAND